jgi:hypothetical protein
MSKLEQAINCSDGDRAAKIIADVLGIESADVAHYVFPKTSPADREQRAHHRRVVADRGALSSLMPPRRFPPQWTVEELPQTGA